MKLAALLLLATAIAAALLSRARRRPAVYLGCGCKVGTHENTTQGWHEAHPELIGWESRGGLQFYDFSPDEPVALFV